MVRKSKNIFWQEIIYLTKGHYIYVQVCLLVGDERNRNVDCRVHPGKHSGASPSAVSGKPNGHVKQFNVVSDLSQIGNMVLTVRLATNLTSAWKHATLHTALETTEAQRNTHAARLHRLV